MPQQLTASQRRKLRKDPEVLARSRRLAEERRASKPHKLEPKQTSHPQQPKLGIAADMSKIEAWKANEDQASKSGYFNTIPDDILNLLTNAGSIRLSGGAGSAWVNDRCYGINREDEGSVSYYGKTGVQRLFKLNGKIFNAWSDASWHGVTRVK